MSPVDTPVLLSALRLGPTHLTVSDLDGSIGFYERSLGLRVHDRDEDVARMGAGGEDLLVLAGLPGVGLGGRHAGLYHFALLHDSREELARAIVRLAQSHTRIEGASDHGVSESVYLRDPDDNGIELYADRPREQWPEPRHPGERVDANLRRAQLSQIGCGLGLSTSVGAARSRRRGRAGRAWRAGDASPPNRRECSAADPRCASVIQGATVRLRDEGHAGRRTDSVPVLLQRGTFCGPASKAGRALRRPGPAMRQRAFSRRLLGERRAASVPGAQG